MFINKYKCKYIFLPSTVLSAMFYTMKIYNLFLLKRKQKPKNNKPVKKQTKLQQLFQLVEYF